METLKGGQKGFHSRTLKSSFLFKSFTIHIGIIDFFVQFKVEGMNFILKKRRAIGHIAHL